MSSWKIDDGYGHLRRDKKKVPAIPTPAMKTRWCNIYGGEDVARSGADAVKNLGGLGFQPGEVAAAGGNVKMWFCDKPAVGRFYLKCEHQHRGTPMDLCLKHYDQYRDKIEFCPRCNRGCDVCEAAAKRMSMDPVEPHNCPNHRCKLRMFHVS